MSLPRLLAAGATLGVACAAGQGPATPSRGLVEQKEALVRRLLNDSPALARIEASGNAQAQGFFRSAREHHAEALRALEAGERARAEAQLNEAMWMAGKARQLVPDPMLREIELRVQNRALARSIDSLRLSYQRHLGRAQGLPRGSLGLDERLRAIDARYEQAASYSSSEHVREANGLLHAVERELMAALSDLLGAETIEYAQRFETQAEEYAYEKSRYESYVELLPIARAELRPGAGALSLMERYAVEADRLHQQGEKSAERRELETALEAVRQATSRLQSALAAAGVRAPSEATAGTPR